MLTGLLFFAPAFLIAQGGTESTFFQQTTAQKGYSMCPSGDGNLYIAGKRNDQLCLMKMSPEGEYLFSYLLDLSLGPAAAAAEIIVDSEGKIAGCGNFEEDTPGNGFVFRFDPVTASVIWVKTLEGINTVVNSIAEQAPGGNFIVATNPHDATGDDAEFLYLSRNNGSLVPGAGRRFNLGSSDSFNAMTLYKGHIYVTGRYTDGFNYDDMRNALSKFDAATGHLIWSRISHVDSSKSARLYGRDVLIDQDAIISTFSGNDNGESLDPTYFFLQKTTLDGDIIWLKKFDLPAWNTEFAEEIVSVSDGYVLLGKTLLEDQGWLFMIKTDKEGNPLWANKIAHEYNNDLTAVAQGQLLAFNNYLYFTGYTEHVPANSRMIVGKTDANGRISPTCDVLELTQLTVLDIDDPVNYAVDLTVSPSPTQVFDIIKPVPAATLLNRLFICRQEGMDDCQDMADWAPAIDSLKCADGKIKLYFTLCNNGGITANDTVPVVFYLGNPTESAATVLGSYFIYGALAPGACQSVVLENLEQLWFPSGLNGAQTVYAVVNDNGSLAPPFSLDSFPITGLPECDYSNNLSFATISGDSPALELGPDIISCTGNPETFNAGSGFFQYLWQDGSTDSTFTATQPGTYRVEVTDYCGYKQVDSVFFTFSLLPDTQFPDSSICPDEVLTYFVPGFDHYTWSPAAGLSCTDCDSVAIQPAVTTQYTLLATTDDGCVLEDTFLIVVLPQPALNRVIEFCPGETVTINGNTYSQPGTVLDTLPATGGGCDTIATYTLQFIPLPQPSFVAIQCPANITVTIPDDDNSAIVNYTLPNASTNCPCGDATLTLEQGLPSGASFPADNTLVCYTAKDDCGTESSCCFTVTVIRPPGDEVCDVKITPCIKYEIMGIFQNPAKQKTYRMRVTNECAGKLEYVAFELPNAMVAEKPADNSTYTAPSGRQYAVRNPNFAPFRSIRFKSLAAGIAGGQSDIFEYTLPPQADPLFIHAIVRLEPQVYYETHLNVFDCEVQQTPNRPEGTERETLITKISAGSLLIYPNPASDAITVDLSGLAGPTARLRVFDLFGRLLMDEKPGADAKQHRIDLSNGWPAGIYLLELTGTDGLKQTARFVKH